MQLKPDYNSSFLTSLILIAPFFLWGTAMVAMKGVIPQTTPLFMAGIRIFPAGFLVLLVAIALGKSQPKTWQGWGWISLFALVDGCMFQGFIGEGLMRTTAGLGSVMIDSQPLAVAIMSRWLFKEIIGFWGWLGLTIGILGISLIGLPDEWIINWLQGNFTNLDFNWQNLFNNGEWLMLLASLSMAVGTIMIPYVSRHVDAVVATGWHLVLGGLVLFIFSFQFETSQWVNLDLSAWLSLSYATIFGSAIAYGLFFFLASKGNLTSLSALTFLTPIFALTFGNLILGETLSTLQLQGVFLTLVSIYLINQREQINQFITPKYVKFKIAIKNQLRINN
ncbi:DMT family transporter [Geminocystis sp. NIES-3709]|uniref:DMT family transporter n=1 Tax=Geminocystis sp. NIES-3709 TaxID=1617448 RepID=UPI0005FC7BE7|nr:DMT family transporter [Geminocystis sp. NIES-3709]BAQ63411.1 permease of the drug/metabolite transporter (DMT) superfamily [Geminocystis sp. NIES-3709]